LEKSDKRLSTPLRWLRIFAEAHIALGLFYNYDVFQYDRALTEFQRALAFAAEQRQSFSGASPASISARVNGNAVCPNLRNVKSLIRGIPLIPDNIGFSYS
jgi:hypothetical protein